MNSKIVKVLITGATGFVGSHLIRQIARQTPDSDIHGTTLPNSASATVYPITLHEIDLRDQEAVAALISEVKPDQIYHLAAQAFVPRSFEDPWDTLENNIKAQLNVTLGCIQSNIKPRMLVISSSEIYGIASPKEMPIREDAPLRPNNPYSVSKVAQDMLAFQYCESHDLPIMRARPFSHIGSGQAEHFVAVAFAMQIARIEAGMQEPILKVGNLSAKRDFTNVRDVVRAYTLLIEAGTPGRAYNIASGKSYSIQYLLDTLLQETDMPITVETDPQRMRPSDIPIMQGDYSRLHRETGWQPEITFEQTLREILEDCRQRVRQRPQGETNK